MVISQNWYHSLGIAIPVITGAVLLGITKSIFGIEASTNLFNTGILIGTALGILNILLAIAVWKHRI